MLLMGGILGQILGVVWEILGVVWFVCLVALCATWTRTLQAQKAESENE